MIRKNLKAVLKRVYRKMQRFKSGGCAYEADTTSKPATQPTPTSPKPNLKETANALISEFEIFSSGALTLVGITQSGSDLTILVDGGPSSSHSKLSSLNLILFNALKADIPEINELRVTTA